MSKEGLSGEASSCLALALSAAGSVVFAVGLLFSGIFEVSPHPILSRLVFMATGLMLILFGASLYRNWNLSSVLGRILTGVAIVVMLFETLSILGLNLLDVMNRTAEDSKTEVLMNRSGVYRPFVLWRSNPLSSDGLNINESGLRIVPGATDSANAFTVFFFGGSTAFGWNTTDSNTISGRLQRLLEDRIETPVHTVNYGQQGYVNTQEVIELQLQLRSGNIPDLAVFYDGSNEIWSAYAFDTAGVHFNLYEIADLYENRYSVREQPGEAIGLLGYLSRSNSAVFLRKLLGLPTGTSGVSLFPEVPSRCMLQGENYLSSSQFADTIMEYYEGNLRTIDALSREFGFDYLCFWQPVVFTGNKPLTADEQDIIDRHSQYLAALYREGEERAIELEYSYHKFHCITDIFDDLEDGVFYDMCHLSVSGDSIVANEIFSRIEDLESINR